MLLPTLPAETTYSDIERDLIENEPPGMFPEDQNSYWGQMRKLFADYLQANAMDLFTAWYNNLDPRFVDANDIAEWEYRVGVPGDRSGLSLTARRTFVQNRIKVGAFSRGLVNSIIENFITATFGASTSFGSGGIALGSGGATLYSGVSGDPKTMYRVYFDYMNRVYYVRVLNTLGEDLSGLTRELQRITPAGWTLNISDVANILDYVKATIDAGPEWYGHLSWNESGGGWPDVAKDFSGYVNNGTLNGAFSGAVASLVSNSPSSAQSFNGTDQFISIPYAGQMKMPSHFTIEAWVKPAVIGYAHMIFSRAGVSVWITSGNKISVDRGNIETVVSTTLSVAAATTYHVAVRVKGRVVEIWVNGVLVNTGTATGDFVSDTGTTYIGRYYSSSTLFFNGTLDEVAFYNRPLSDAKIIEHYKTGTNVA